MLVFLGMFFGSLLKKINISSDVFCYHAAEMKLISRFQSFEITILERVIKKRGNTDESY
jgi:hypothetical protein